MLFALFSCSCMDVVVEHDGLVEDAADVDDDDAGDDVDYIYI